MEREKFHSRTPFLQLHNNIPRRTFLKRAGGASVAVLMMQSLNADTTDPAIVGNEETSAGYVWKIKQITETWSEPDCSNPPHADPDINGGTYNNPPNPPSRGGGGTLGAKPTVPALNGLGQPIVPTTKSNKIQVKSSSVETRRRYIFTRTYDSATYSYKCKRDTFIEYGEQPNPATGGNPDELVPPGAKENK